jgi:hypothetical protein
MFYHGSIDDKLRFGDVVKGYISAIPKLSKPFEYANIEIQIPQFSVVLDPCCEIGNGKILLSPLEEISPELFDIPNLSKDVTLLNCEGKAKDFFHPKVWNKLSDEEKTEALVATPKYGHIGLFVYEGNPLFPEYTVIRTSKYTEVIDPKTNLAKYEEVKQVTKFSTRSRMISFKTIHRVDCKLIVTPRQTTNEAILGSIILQLSKQTRKLLRQKMAYYFLRPPPEDT